MKNLQSLNIVFPAKEKIEVRTETAPEPDDNHVLCKVEKSFISTGTETRCLRGIFDEGTNWASWVKYPFYPGYSVAATVIECGKVAGALKPGTRVACKRPHKQYFTADPKELVVIPDGVGFEAAAASPVSITAQQGVRRAEIKLGETAVVIGLGIIGQFVVQYLNLMGLRKVIVMDTVAERLQMAQKHGATHIVNPKKADAPKEIEEITEGRMADMVFDVTGNPAVLQQAVRLCRKLGRVILLGDTTVPTQQCLGPGVVSNSIRIDGIHLAMSPAEYTVFNPWTYEEMVKLYLEYVRIGKMNADDLISHTYNPFDAPRVYNDLLEAKGDYLGVVFDWRL